MVNHSHLVVSVVLLAPLLGIVSGFAINSRDPKLSLSSLPSPSVSQSPPHSTQNPVGSGIGKGSQSPAHHVPLDISSRDSSTSSDTNPDKVSVVKREVSFGENRFLYDPSMLIMPKRSAAALNKLLLAVPGFYEPSGRVYSNSNVYDNDLQPVNKERNYLDSNMEPFLQNAPQRRNQKDSNKKYLRCFFNAVSCFRK